MRFACLLAAIAMTFARAARAEEDAVPLSARRQIDKIVRARKADLVACYRQEQPRLGVASGRIDVRWMILPSGKVDAAWTMTDAIGSPDLRQCIELAVQRWTFPRFSFGAVMVDMPFAFTPKDVTVSHAAEAVSDVPDVDRGTLRASLLRFGPNFVSVGCVAGKRSFLGSVCDAAIGRAPHIGTNPAYKTDSAVVDVRKASIRFEHERLDVPGFEIAHWPHAPAGTQKDSGPFDGFGVWPPGAFTVQLTPQGKREIHSGVVWRCRDEPWAACHAADRPRDGGADPSGSPDEWPLAEGRLAREATRLLAPAMRRYAPGWQLRLGQTLSLDLDGDGTPETLYNLAATRLQFAGSTGWNRPTEMFFIVAERGGNLVRLPVETAASRVDGMDGAVLGWLDIDGDGRPEIWLDTPRFEGRTWQLVRFRDGAFRPVAEFGFHFWGVFGRD